MSIRFMNPIFLKKNVWKGYFIINLIYKKLSEDYNNAIFIFM